MEHPQAQDHPAWRRIAVNMNQIIAAGLWGLIAFLWTIELLADWRRPPGQFSEPYGWVIGMMLLPFAASFQLAVVGWRLNASWRWAAQVLPMGAVLLVWTQCF